MITKDDFVDWMNHPVTYQFMLGIHERIQEAKETLAGSAGLDPMQDRFICGMIRTYSEVLHIEVDDVVKEQDNVETSGSESTD